MPIYEYECDGCHQVFEVRQRMTDPPPAAHDCGSTQMHRVLSATSFVLKGTGWYATDYGNRSQPPSEGDSAKSAPSDAKTGAEAGNKAAGTATEGSKAAPKAEGSASSSKAPPAKGSGGGAPTAAT